MHISEQLPAIIAAGVEREKDLAKEEIELVGGGTVVNELWGAPLRTYTVPFAARGMTEEIFKGVMRLAEATSYGSHTFDYFDELDNELVRVRFTTKLVTSHVEGDLWRIEPTMLREEPDPEAD